MLKMILGLAVFVTALFYGKLQAQTLDDAIKNAASELSRRLNDGSVVAVINFQSQSARLADYTIDELNSAIVNIGKITPVERRRLDTVRGELELGVSGEVSDESAQRIGQMLGAQSIITGSIEIIGSVYRIRFQAVATETAAIQYAFSENINNNSVLESLLQETDYLLDFTFKERLGASALNLLYGAGSFFVERDKFGGGVTVGLEGLGTVLFVYAPLASFNTRKDSYNERYSSIEKSYEAYPFFIGIGCYVGGAVFGIIRSQIYRKAGYQIAVSQFDRPGMGLVSSADGGIGLKISYAWRF
jgi:hypothetical protein